MRRNRKGFITFLVQLIISISILILAYKIGDEFSKRLKTKIDRRSEM